MVSQSVYTAPSSTWTSGDPLVAGVPTGKPPGARTRSRACSTTYRYAPGYRCPTKEKPGPPGEGGPGGWEGDYDGEIRAAIRLAGSARSSIRLTRTYNGPDWTSVEPAMKTMPSPWPNTQISAASSTLMRRAHRLSVLLIKLRPTAVSSAASKPLARVGLIATTA